jgi:hypothetical protein
MKNILLNITKMDTQYIDTNYEFDNFVKSEDEDYEIDYNYVHGYPNASLMNIKGFRDLLLEFNDEIESGEITHIDIDYNEDHQEYEISLFKIEVSEEDREIPEVDPIQEEIDALEARIKKLKNQQIQLGDLDDLPF